MSASRKREPRLRKAAENRVCRVGYLPRSTERQSIFDDQTACCYISEPAMKMASLGLVFLTSLCSLSCAAAPLDAQRLTSGHFDAAAQAILNAAQSGDAALFRSLSAGPVQLSGTAENGTTFLQWALAHGKKRTFLLLLRSGADPAQIGCDGDTVIHDAARHSDPSWLELLLENGAHPDARNASSGTLPLHQALIADRARQFEALLKAGADPDLADDTGNAALHIAAQINKPWRVLMLLMNPGKPADPFIRNAQKSTFQRYLFMTDDRLLNKQTRAGRKAVLDYLLSKGIPIDSSVPPRHERTFKRP